MSNMKGKGSTSKVIATGGILLALSLVCLYVASIIPGVELTLYAVSSIFIPIMMIESKGKGGWILYAACSILALLILPNKMGAIPYIFFFGIYGIIKLYIEKLKNPVIQIMLKLGVFTIIMVVFYNFFYEFFFGVITLPEFPIVVLLAAGEIFFILYDAILTGAINYYYSKIYGHI